MFHGLLFHFEVKLLRINLFNFNFLTLVVVERGIVCNGINIFEDYSVVTGLLNTGIQL